VPFDEDLVGRYVSALCNELKMLRESAGSLKTVYIGGGTPSLIPPEQFVRIFSCLRDTFTIRPSAEITVEANPGTVSEEKLRRLYDLGVNRISMGVQSFDDRDLALLGRIHSSDEAIQSARLIRSAGIDNISLDLMYAIPGQTLEAWKMNLAQALDLAIPHISAYELTPEPGTPLHKSIIEGILSMPDEAEIVDMFNTTEEILAEAGLRQYEISNYARPGLRCLHNLNYWDRGEYLAAGAGAHAFAGGIRSRNAGNVITYMSKVEKSESPVAESSSPDREEALRETIFLGLRKTEGLPVQKCVTEGIPLLQLCQDLIKDGYLQDTGDTIRFSRRAMVISNEILVQIFRRLGL
jgi:oxygen-independent coproporphyrinogen-3 oxidase